MVEQFSLTKPNSEPLRQKNPAPEQPPTILPDESSIKLPKKGTIFQSPEAPSLLKKVRDFFIEALDDTGYTAENLEKLSKRQKLKEAIKKRIFHGKQPFVDKFVEGLGLFGAPDIRVAGTENLENAMRLNNGKNVVFILNHISNFDTPAFERALKCTGFGEIVERLIFLQGIKLDKNPLTKFLTVGFNRIKVWPPNFEPKNDKEKVMRSELTRSSIKLSKKALEEGFILAIYGEGGRSYSGELKQIEPAVINFLKLQSNTVVVPVAIFGTDKVMPPGSPFIFPADQVRVDFAESLDMNSMMEKYKTQTAQEEKKAISDIIMKRIADKLPAEKRGYYK